MGLDSTVEKLVVGIIGVIVVMLLFGGFAALLTNASGNVAASGLPLVGNLFGGSNPIVLVLIVIGIFLGLMGAAMNLYKRRK